MRKYVVRCGSRSGSTFLCDLLISTNRCGKPVEYFNPSLEEEYKKELNAKNIADFYEYRKLIVQKTKTDNNVVGMKIVGVNEQWNSFSKCAFNPQYWIRLEREDKIMQAISRYRAWKTNKWVVREESKIPNSIEYSFSDIKWCFEEVMTEEKVFDNFFKDKDHLHIRYKEDLLNHPEVTINTVLQYMNISTDELPRLKSSNKVLRDSESDRWKKWFLEDLKKEAVLEQISKKTPCWESLASK